MATKLQLKFSASQQNVEWCTTACRTGVIYFAYFRGTEKKVRRGEERDKNNACTHSIVQAVQPPDTPLLTSQSQR